MMKNIDNDYKLNLLLFGKIKLSATDKSTRRQYYKNKKLIKKLNKMIKEVKNGL